MDRLTIIGGGFMGGAIAEGLVVTPVGPAKILP